MQNTYDVIILGAGASGMTAALAVHENGLSVGLFEKQNLVGGTAGTVSYTHLTLPTIYSV